jgi:hypothetical protein
VQPIRENVRRDALLVLQQLAEVPPPAEDHVPQDQQRPGIAKNLQRKIDRAQRPVCVTHRLQDRARLPRMQLVAK